MEWSVEYTNAFEVWWDRLTAAEQEDVNWRGRQWQRGRVILTDADIDQMEPKRWARCLRRWTTRRPRARMERNG